MHSLPANIVSLADLICFSKVSEYLNLHSKRYDIRSEITTSLSELGGKPAVLIGGFNNEWALRLLKELRFSFEADPAVRMFSIRDNQNTQNRWSVDFNQPYGELAEDYAIVTRVVDPTTEQLLVSVAGITRIGTIAAGEFLASPASLRSFSKDVPQGLRDRNLQNRARHESYQWGSRTHQSGGKCFLVDDPGKETASASTVGQIIPCCFRFMPLDGPHANSDRCLMKAARG
jgi:hypothetical protein